MKYIIMILFISFPVFSNDLRTERYFAKIYNCNTAITRIILKNANEYEVNPKIIFSLIKYESKFNIMAYNKNKNGSVDRGIMMLNSLSFPKMKVRDFYNAEINIRLGTKYLKDCLVKSKGNIILGLAYYNLGYSHVKRYGISSLITVDYINKIVLDFYMEHHIQSGEKKSTKRSSKYNKENPVELLYTPKKAIYENNTYDDVGGCSKILHKCSYENEDIFIYCPKVNKEERNMNMGDSEEQLSAASEFRPNHLEKTLSGESGNPYGRFNPQQNNHPTVKPISLLIKILSLFKTPNPQKILDTFMGSGSTGIACKKLDLDFIGIELDENYFEIAKKRIGR